MKIAVNKKNIIKICVECIALLIFINLVFNMNIVRADEAEYKLMINKALNCITVYSKDDDGNYTKPIKSMICSTPADKNIIQNGIYQISISNEWKPLADGTYVQYGSDTTMNITIGSVPYTTQNKSVMITDEFNGLGNDFNRQVISLTVADAKWIYDNCKSGTAIEIYEDVNTAGPLDKPTGIKINNQDAKSKWDPTDTDSSNPWLNINVRIEGTKNLETNIDDKIDLMQGVKAYDTCGNDITDNVIIMGDYDFGKAGSYYLTYYVSDATGKQTKNDVTLKVKEGMKTAASSGNMDNTASSGNIEDNSKDGKSFGTKLKNIIVLSAITFIISLMIIKYTKKD